MNRPQEVKIERIKQHMFAPEGKKNYLTPEETEIMERCSKIFTMWIDEPWQSEPKLRSWVINNLGRTDKQARNDIYLTKFILGDVKNAGRNFHQHMVNEMFLKIFRKAEASGDWNLANNAARNYATFNRLDKDLPVELPYDQIIPVEFDLVGDVTVLNLKPIANIDEVRRKLREKYVKKAEEIFFEELDEQSNGNG